MNSPKKKINWEVVTYSLLALGFMGLAFWVNWMFIVGAIVLVALNQKKIMNKK
jgi:hypothetical protein